MILAFPVNIHLFFYKYSMLRVLVALLCLYVGNCNRNVVSSHCLFLISSSFDALERPGFVIVVRLVSFIYIFIYKYMYVEEISVSSTVRSAFLHADSTSIA